VGGRRQMRGRARQVRDARAREAGAATGVLSNRFHGVRRAC